MNNVDYVIKAFLYYWNFTKDRKAFTKLNRGKIDITLPKVTLINLLVHTSFS